MRWVHIAVFALMLANSTLAAAAAVITQDNTIGCLSKEDLVGTSNKRGMSGTDSAFADNLLTGVCRGFMKGHRVTVIDVDKEGGMTRIRDTSGMYWVRSSAVR